jgi:hypothetical protein
MTRRIGPILVAMSMMGPAAAAAQKTGVAITPFIGATLFNRDLLLRPGLDPATQAERQSLVAIIGARLNIGLSPKIELQGDLSYGSSGLKITSLSAPVGTDASVMAMAGQVVYRLKPSVEPFSLAIHGGVGAVKRSFSEKNGTPATIADKTSVGAMLGATLNFRATSRTAVTIGIDDFVYNASFVMAAAGNQPGGTTQSLTQNDLRISLGLRIAVAGQ